MEIKSSNQGLVAISEDSNQGLGDLDLQEGDLFGFEGIKIEPFNRQIHNFVIAEVGTRYLTMSIKEPYLKRVENELYRGRENALTLLHIPEGDTQEMEWVLYVARDPLALFPGYRSGAILYPEIQTLEIGGGTPMPTYHVKSAFVGQEAN